VDSLSESREEAEKLRKTTNYKQEGQCGPGTTPPHGQAKQFFGNSMGEQNEKKTKNPTSNHPKWVQAGERETQKNRSPERAAPFKKPEVPKGEEGKRRILREVT